MRGLRFTAIAVESLPRTAKQKDLCSSTKRKCQKMKTGSSNALILATLVTVGLQRNAAFAGDLALTIYNQNFAVVRDKVTLELSRGTNRVRFAEATAFLEPSSVILRDPSGKHPFQVLEQNYRGDPVSQEMMLALNEGKTIDFEITTAEGGQTRRDVMPGKIVRSGSGQIFSPYSDYANTGMQPIIEVNGNCVSACQVHRFFQHSQTKRY